MIINGDSLHELKHLPADSIDFVCTDPPYGYSFMGKDWDKAVPSVEIWQECLRVLKPGAFCCVMSAPRSDVQNAMISRLMEAGFRLDFTPIYWTYASGFPKAGNIGKLVDKRLGAERETIRVKPRPETSGTMSGSSETRPWIEKSRELGYHEVAGKVAVTDQAKQLDGSYAGFQPKPAVEVIIVAMKPLSEKTYVDQALKREKCLNCKGEGHYFTIEDPEGIECVRCDSMGYKLSMKGVSWLDDCRVPTISEKELHWTPQRYNAENRKNDNVYGAGKGFFPTEEMLMYNPQGRFPANLIVSDDVLNDGVVTKSSSSPRPRGGTSFRYANESDGREYPSDSGSYSRYFDLDKWATTLPFLITPKASKSEKNAGLEALQAKEKFTMDGGERIRGGADSRVSVQQNFHPTVKPLKLMSYLITLFSRPGDTVLDPFVGSGTTCVAAKQLDRECIGIEREAEYAEIATARLAHLSPVVPQLPPELPEPGQPPVTINDITKPIQASLF